ncbi:MAG: SMP-30/gluconolactonase/LRE family protein [Bacteroidales bacterium]
MNQQDPQNYEVVVADSTVNSLGEGAIWDAAGNRLFYVDILGKKLFEYYPESGEKNVHEMPSMIGTVVVRTDDEVLVALEDGIYSYNLTRRELNFLVCPPQNDSTQRFNDGKCDPAGRLWVGTMSLQGDKKKSHLFCLDPATGITVKLDGITTSNGIVWSSDKEYMYYIDTPTQQVMEFKYDNSTGDISEPRIAVQVADSLGYPDGMAIDGNDNLWVCMWGGSSVCCFDRKTGKLLERISVPAKNVTSCAFTGDKLNEMYITTARIATSDEEIKTFPNAGSLFKITLKYKGSHSNRYKINNRVL